MNPENKERISDLFALLRRVEEESCQNEQNLSQLNKSRDKQGVENREFKPSQKQKLKLLYKNTISSHETESKALREALDVVVNIRQTLRQFQKKLISTASGNQLTGNILRRGALMKILQQSASALPLFIPESIGQQAPPLCGCIPADSSYVAKSGDMVAALVPSPDGDGSKVWVLGEVVQYISGSGKYEIDDIDEEQKDRHLIGRRRVIPLPTLRANPPTNPEALFPRDTLVLALYPRTTCFYQAMIDSPPADPTQEYMVCFEDQNYAEGYSPPYAVPQRYVIASREPKK